MNSSKIRALLAIVTVMIAAVLGASPAAAHSELVSSAPADGSAQSAPPAQVVLTFNEIISDAGLQVVAQGPSGSVALPAPTVNGTTVTTEWPQTESGGEYQVSYRVVSADGHPIDGTIRFSYPGEAGEADDPAAASAADSSAGAVPVPLSETTDATVSETEGGFPLWLPVVVVIVGVAIGASIARALRRRNATHTADS